MDAHSTGSIQEGGKTPTPPGIMKPPNGELSMPRVRSGDEEGSPRRQVTIDFGEGEEEEEPLSPEEQEERKLRLSLLKKKQSDLEKNRALYPLDHWWGFVVAVCVFFAQFGIYGVSNSYSVFSHDIEHDDSLGRPSSTEVSFGVSTSNGIAPILAIFAGALTDHLGPRVVLGLSAVLAMMASLLSSFAPNTPLLIVLYSLPCCLSSACLSAPGSAAVTSWLKKRLSLGMGIAYSGNGGGSSVIVPIAGQLAQRYSWRVSFRIMAVFPFIALVAAMFTSFRVKPKPRRFLNEMERAFLRNLLTSRSFWTLFTAAMTFSFVFFSALYIIVPYASSYGKPGTVYENYERIKVGTAATLFTFFGVCKWGGSVMFGAIAARTDTRYVYAASCGMTATVICLWPLCDGFLTLAVNASFLGLGFAGMFATLPSMTGHCFAGPNCGLALGCTMASFSVGGFSGPPTITAIREAQGGSYTLSFGIMALVLTVSGAIILLLGGGKTLKHQHFSIPEEDAQASLAIRIAAAEQEASLERATEDTERGDNRSAL